MESSSFSDFFSFINRPGSTGGPSQGGTTGAPGAPSGTRLSNASPVGVGAQSSSPLDLSGSGSRTGDVQAGLGGGATADGADDSYVEDITSGVDITSSTFSFTTPSQSSSLPHLRCTPIAFYTSESRAQTGRLIAVSDTYISYAIKEGHIRVINRHTVVRTLLKGHKKPVLDAAFASPQANVLASIGGDGSLILWRISEGADTGNNTNEIVHEVLMQLQGLSLSRVVWHPLRANTLAVARPGEVALFDFTDLVRRSGEASGRIEATTLASVAGDWHIAAHQGPVLDLSFSKDGKYLITAGQDGWARVWQVESRTAVGRWQPYGGEAVSRALFLHRIGGPSTGETLFVATGGRGDTEVKLWRSWTSLVPVLTQTLTMATDDGRKLDLRIEADPSGSSFLFLADSSAAVLYVAHVLLSPSSAKLDRLTTFQLKHPVLSYLALSADATSAHQGSGGASEGTEIQLYCVQTAAIQIYHVRPSDCLSTTPTSTSASASSTPLSTPLVPPPSPAANGPSKAPSSSVTTTQDAEAPRLPSPAQVSVPAPVSAPAPAPARPGILQMLLSSANRSSSNVSAGTPGGSGEGTAGGDNGIAGVAEPPATRSTDTNNTQSVSSSVVETKQTGGAQTTEQGGGASGASGPRPSQSGEQSSSANALAPPPPQLTAPPATAVPRPRTEEPRRASPPQAKVTAASAPPVVPPPVPSAVPSTQASAKPIMPASSMGGGGVGSSVRSDEVMAELLLTRNALAKIEEGQRKMNQQLEATIKKSVNEALVRLAPDLQRSVTSGVVPAVEQAVRAAVAAHTDTIPAQISASLAGAGAALSESVREPLSAAFRQSFGEQLIPAFQNATQKMFAQMSQTLDKGVTSRLSAGSLETKQEVASLREEVRELLSCVKALSGEVQRMGVKLEQSAAAAAAAGAGGAGGLDGSHGKDGSQGGAADKKAIIRQLAQARQYDAAMKEALTANSMELVTWLCKQLPKDSIFAAEPPLISQTALLCMLQQLTFNLTTDTSVKLEWVHEIMLVLNPADSEIANFVADVCQESQANLERYSTDIAARGIADPETVKEVRFVQRSIKKLLTDLGR